jgi:hypothetical protein
VPPAASIVIIAIIACAVVAYLIHVCLFIRYKARGAANSKGSRVLWIIASVVLGPLVWPVWWLTHRSAAKTPSSVYPQESFSLYDPLISKPSAPLIDDDDDSLPAPSARRFDAAAHAPAACPVAGGVAAGAVSSFHQATAQQERVPDDMTDQYFTMDIMRDPVFAVDGFTYERCSIEAWFAKGKTTSPKTGAELSSLSLIPNHDTRARIQEWQAGRGAK